MLCFQATEQVTTMIMSHCKAPSQQPGNRDALAVLEEVNSHVVTHYGPGYMVGHEGLSPMTSKK